MQHNSLNVIFNMIFYTNCIKYEVIVQVTVTIVYHLEICYNEHLSLNSCYI